MNLNPYELSLIAGGFGIVGAILGVYIGYYFSIRLMNRQEFNKAAAEFRAAFVDEIFRMRRGVDILHGRFGERPEEIAIANEKAKIIFEAFLPDDMKRGFNAAWDKYKNPDEINSITCNPLDPEYSKELGNIYLVHINNLLSYAKPK